ncbi:MAG: hypothetical protein C4524_05620 [Candidatus Zixiibacteriota bacterium]|nr:MAG: hypothetical protein C4524_05620 [candidate division Zixibacteria bacterium]
MLAGIMPAATASGADWRYNGSLYYADGDYVFTQRTHSLYFTHGVSLSGNRYDFSVSLPLVYQDSPWISYSGRGVIPSGGTEHGQFHPGGRGRHVTLPDTAQYDRIGLADPTLHGEWEVVSPQGARPFIRVTGDLKAPLADPDQGFGTGAWDAAAGVSLGSVVSPSWMLFLDASWWFLGDMPDLELKDALGYSVAAGYVPFLSSWRYLAFLSGGTSMITGMDPPLDAGLGVGWRLSPAAGLNATVTAGLTEASPDLSVGLGWSLEL